MINLESEIEIRNLHGKLDLLMTEQMKTLFEIQKTQVDLMEDIKLIINSSPERTGRPITKTSLWIPLHILPLAPAWVKPLPGTNSVKKQ